MLRTLALPPACEHVKELAAHPVTSPRLRGEVGICAPERGFRVRGVHPPATAALRTTIKRPLTQPSPRKRGEGESCGSDAANVRFLHTLFWEVTIQECDLVATLR